MASGGDHRPLWAQRLTQQRRAHHWSQTDTLNAIRAASPIELPADESLRRNWKRWEAGTTKPRSDTQLVIARAFGADPDQLFDDDDAVHPGIEVVTDLGTIELLERVRRGDLDQSSLDAITLTVDQLASDYSAMLPPELLAEANSWLQRLDHLRQQRAGSAQHAQIMEATAWLALLAGSLLFDLDRTREADLVRRHVDQIGREINNGHIQAWAAELHTWLALNDGRFDEAVKRARVGQEMAPHRPVATQLAGHESEALARMGDLRGAEVALDKMMTTRQAIPEPEYPRHHFQLDPSKFDKVEMRLYLLSGEDEEAANKAHQILARMGGPERARLVQPMLTAKSLATLGVVAARSGELDEAVALGHEALEIPRQTIPSLIITTSDLREALADKSDVPMVNELLERIADLRRPAA